MKPLDQAHPGEKASGRMDHIRPLDEARAMADKVHARRLLRTNSRKRQRSHPPVTAPPILPDVDGQFDDAEDEDAFTTSTPPKRLRRTTSGGESNASERRGNPRKSPRHRFSRFKEASMHDRVSERPPAVYLQDNTVDSHMEQAEHGITVQLPRIKEAKVQAGQSSSTRSQASSEGNEGSQLTRDSGIFRFGKALASIFKPDFWDGVFGNQKQEDTMDIQRKFILNDRQARAERAYAEMKKQQQVSTQSHLPDHDKVQALTQTSAPRGGITIGIPPRQKELQENMDLTLHKQTSKRDLHKQLKLQKKVSDLESKLEAARRELNASLGTDETDARAHSTPLIGKRRLLTTLPSLPSERAMLSDFGESREYAFGEPGHTRQTTEEPVNSGTHSGRSTSTTSKPLIVTLPVALPQAVLEHGSQLGTEMQPPPQPAVARRGRKRKGAGRDRKDYSYVPAKGDSDDEDGLENSKSTSRKRYAQKSQKLAANDSPISSKKQLQITEEHTSRSSGNSVPAQAQSVSEMAIAEATSLQHHNQPQPKFLSPPTARKKSGPQIKPLPNKETPSLMLAAG